jgi:XTP/dITP diphosphohydrolase
VLADDSGLEVDALHGAPGVHSARFAALDSGAPGNSSDAENNAKLLRLLKDIPREQRSARFRCVLALADISPASAAQAPQFFEGACEGRIEFAPSGGGGFGYDPLFVPEGFTQSFAELGEDVKNRLSHRARAFAKFREAFKPRSEV